MTQKRWRGKLALALAAALGAYLIIAYALLPVFWREDDARDPVLDRGMLTETADGRPGDPLNVLLVAEPPVLLEAFAAAGWRPADPITFETSLGIAASVVFDRPDPDAPVSPLFYENRKEDLAFEKPVGTSADRRQHIRLWSLPGEGAAIFVGAVTFDAGVGFSHYTGAVTHRIAPDIDAARTALGADLQAAGVVGESGFVPGRGATGDGRNGEGDLYRTDGRALRLVLRPRG